LLDSPTYSLWACPVCQSELQRELGQWRCAHNHSFDIAKQGYANLLLANQKRSREPGDTRQMMDSRRAFLQGGHYQPLAEKLAELFHSLPQQARLLDSGCGEGYYLAQLAQQRPDLQLSGIDISRDAVKLAARQLPQAEFAVASSFHLPVLSQTVDAVLRVFAPGDNDEVRRVLKPRGQLAIVYPGPRHLFGLKQVIYREPREHNLPALLEGFQQVQEQRVQYRLELQGQAAVGQLLSMTPFYWKGNRQAKTQLEQLDFLSTEVDFLIRCFQPASDMHTQQPGSLR